MRTALYFPHTEVRSESVVRTALLTWDSLETIVPYKGYVPQYGNRQMAEAMEIIGAPRTPTDREKNDVHDAVENLLRDGVPEIFSYSTAFPAAPYEIWPQKLAPSTWRLLQEQGLTDSPLANADYPTTPAAGLCLMAVLADVLAGTTRARITDRADAYATIANAPKSVVEESQHELVVPLTLKAASLDEVPIERLIEFRKREAKEGGHDYRALRHNYLDAIDKHVAVVSKLAPNSADRIELDRVFTEGLEDDLKDIKQELGFTKSEAFLSKDVITLALVSTTAVAAWATTGNFSMPELVAGTSGVVLLGGLLGTRSKLAKSRRDVLRKHPMAYLYEAQA